MSDISPLIRQHRKLAGLSQLELADLAGIGKATVFDIEHGKETVSVVNLMKVLNALNIRVELHSPLGEGVTVR